MHASQRTVRISRRRAGGREGYERQLSETMPGVEEPYASSAPVRSLAYHTKDQKQLHYIMTLIPILDQTNCSLDRCNTIKLSSTYPLSPWLVTFLTQMLSVSHANFENSFANSDYMAPCALVDLDPYPRTTSHRRLVDNIDHRSDLRRPFYANRTAVD